MHPVRATTPYGVVLQYMDLTVEGKLYRWPFLDPFATLWYSCQICPGYALMLRDSLAGTVGGIVIYADEVTPGNVLRPDSGTLARYRISNRITSWAWCDDRALGVPLARCEYLPLLCRTLHLPSLLCERSGLLRRTLLRPKTNLCSIAGPSSGDVHKADRLGASTGASRTCLSF